MLSLFTLTIVIIVALFALYFAVTNLVRHTQLRKDYRAIPSLPISRIPFLGNIQQIGGEGYVFLRLILQMANECQEQKKGLFCLWYSLWPIMFMCSGQTVEVKTIDLQFPPFSTLILVVYQQTAS